MDDFFTQAAASASSGNFDVNPRSGSRVYFDPGTGAVTSAGAT